ncbi:ABC transporter [Microbacterium sp. H83]|nr:ABC transporter [Microbacterium sp. H83]
MLEPAPEVAEPEAAEPEVAEPEIAEPAVVEPEAAEPAVAESESEVVEQEVAEPATEAADPETVAPDAEPREAEPAPSADTEQPAVADIDAPSTVEDAESVTESAADPVDREEPVVETVPETDGAPSERPIGGADSASAVEAIRIRGLVKTFGDQVAVNGIDLTVPAGSFYGIVGPNGAGKTTTLSIVAGLLRADGGSVEICGIDQAAKPLAAKRMMGVLPDRLRTFDRLTGRQLLYYYGLLRGLASDVIEKRVGDLARAFDLGDALNRVVSDYSAGMTKKIMLAGAMIHSPRVLVLDEPFEAVDPVSSAVILDILRAYVAHGGTVILSSHGMDLVERVCSRVAIIVGGDVLAEGTIEEVRAGQTLEARFVELSGGISEVEGLEWLHTFSD